METVAMLLALLMPTTNTNAVKGSHYYDAVNPRLGNVTHCLYGEMTLKDNGMLVDTSGSAVNFHELMENPEINGIPEQTAIDAAITVCQNGGRLVYKVQ